MGSIAAIILCGARLDELHSGTNNLDSERVLLVFCLNDNEVFHGEKEMSRTEFFFAKKFFR
jgi:hypothetical protein